MLAGAVPSLQSLGTTGIIGCATPSLVSADLENSLSAEAQRAAGFPGP